MTEKGNYEIENFFRLFISLTCFYPIVLSNEIPLFNVFVNVWMLIVIRQHTVLKKFPFLT